MPPCFLIYAWPDAETAESRENIFRLLDRLDACLSDSKVLSRSQRADKASKNIVQKGQNDIIGTLLTNQVTRTRAHACVATGCARPPIGGADRVLQAARNSYHCSVGDSVLCLRERVSGRGVCNMSIRYEVLYNWESACTCVSTKL